MRRTRDYVLEGEGKMAVRFCLVSFFIVLLAAIDIHYSLCVRNARVQHTRDIRTLSSCTRIDRLFIKNRFPLLKKTFERKLNEVPREYRKLARVPVFTVFFFFSFFFRARTLWFFERARAF